MSDPYDGEDMTNKWRLEQLEEDQEELRKAQERLRKAKQNNDSPSYAQEALENAMRHDSIHHPNHYTWRGGMECRDIATEMCRGSEGVAAADIYNAVKYIYRYPKKGGIEDIDKAIESLHHLKKVEVGK